jgi:hypothetical protein
MHIAGSAAAQEEHGAENEKKTKDCVNPWHITAPKDLDGLVGVLFDGMQSCTVGLKSVPDKVLQVLFGL